MLICRLCGAARIAKIRCKWIIIADLPGFSQTSPNYFSVPEATVSAIRFSIIKGC